MKILMFSTHSMKYIWYSPQKSKYPLYTSFSECPMDLQAPKHGSIQYSKDKLQASIRCQEGYKRSGSATVKCENGKWTIFETICIVIGN